MINEIIGFGIWINLQPLSPPWRPEGWDWKLQPSNHRTGSSGNPHPQVLSKGCLNIQKTPLRSHHLRNSKGFRGSVPETRMKTKYIFIILNHNITYAQSRRYNPMFSSRNVTDLVFAFSLMIYFKLIFCMLWGSSHFFPHWREQYFPLNYNRIDRW